MRRTRRLRNRDSTRPSISRYAFLVFDQDNVSPCTATLTAPTSFRERMSQTPLVAAASAATSCLQRPSADRRRDGVVSWREGASVSQRNVLIRSFLLSQRGENRKLPNSAAFSATASVKTACSSSANPAAVPSAGSSVAGSLVFVRSRALFSSEIP